MASCITCSAPLPAGVDVCPYCGSTHDTDFHAIHRYTVSKPVAERVCPRCEQALQTINLHAEKKFYIERCETCKGIFFDPGELEALLDNTVSNVFVINQRRMDSVAKELYRGRSSIKYLKCPQCREFMRRTNYASRSGVIVDSCRDHGVWLDGGELNRLMEWKKSGGELLHEKLSARKGKSGANSTATGDQGDAIADALLKTRKKSTSSASSAYDHDLLSSVTDIVFRLFK